MELSDIIALTMLPVGFSIGLNLRTYKDTKKWLKMHRIDNFWNENSYKELGKESFRGHYYII